MIDKEMIIKLSEYYNMSKVCELANVNYGTFRNWKRDSTTYPLSKEKMEQIFKAMESLPECIINEE